MWLREELPEYAPGWIEEMYSKLSELREFPDRCPPAPEAAVVAREIRHLLVGRRRSQFRVLYEVRESVVWVLRVRRSKQDSLEKESLEEGE